MNPYDSEVKSFSYEIRTSDGSKVLENKKIKNLVKEDQYLSVDVEIGSDLRMNQEYSMQIALELDEGTAYYYTRVVSRSQVHASDYAAFVKYFMKRVLTKSQQMHWEVIWNHRQQEQQRITRELILILP